MEEREFINRFLFLILEFIIILLFLTLSFPSYSESLNPFSYRHDYYLLPVENKIQKQALLRYKLNWKKPSVALPYPLEVTDREGGKVISHQGKRRISLSPEGDITYFANNTRTHTKRILSKGGFYLFRVYVGRGSLREVKNEFGETIGWEEYGLDGKLLLRYDACRRPLYKYEYDKEGYWEYNFINKIWKRYERGIPGEERRGSKKGALVAYWREGEFFGKSGLWRIEKGWDGEKITDLFYTLYDPFGKEWYEVYHKEGYLVKRGMWKKHRLVLEENLTEFSYRKYGDFGIEEEKYIENHMADAVWRYERRGSRIVRAIRIYPDQDFYDERIYDINQNIDKVVRKDRFSDEVIAVLKGRIYFGEVKNMSVEELKDFFDVSWEVANYLYEWKEEMKLKDKSDASLFGIRDFTKETILLYDEYNLPKEEITFLVPSF